MTIEIRQLVIKAVVVDPASSARLRDVVMGGNGQVSEAVLIARCTRSVLQALEQRNER